MRAPKKVPRPLPRLERIPTGLPLQVLPGLTWRSRLTARFGDGEGIDVWPRSGGASHETLAHPQQWLAFPGMQRPVSISFDGYGVAAVCDDGSLWVGGSLPYRLLGQEAAQTASTEMVRYGEESDWKHVELVGRMTAVGIKRDGSMWTWELGGPAWRRDFWRPPLVPLSEYTVWVSVCCYGRASLALGRDGTLCLWGDPEGDADSIAPVATLRGCFCLPAFTRSRSLISHPDDRRREQPLRARKAPLRTNHRGGAAADASRRILLIAQMAPTHVGGYAGW